MSNHFVDYHNYVDYHFLDIYENPRRKKFINPSCPKHSLKDWDEKWHKF